MKREVRNKGKAGESEVSEREEHPIIFFRKHDGGQEGL